MNTHTPRPAPVMRKMETDIGWLVSYDLWCTVRNEVYAKINARLFPVRLHVSGSID